MKKALLLTLMTVSFISSVQAKALIGTFDSYIIEGTGDVVSIATNAFSDDGRTAEYTDYRLGKTLTVETSRLSKSTREEIDGVKAGETVLVGTEAMGTKQIISRICTVYNLFENRSAYVGCKTYQADKIPGYQIPERLTYIVKDVSQVVAEVESLDGFSKGDVAELNINTANAKAGRNVKILAILANGEALVEKTGFNILNTGGILHRFSLDRVKLQDLSKK